MGGVSLAGVPALAPGRPWPMGAHVDETGVNFAVFSAHATRIELCVYDDDGRLERWRQPLPARTGEVWHGHVPGAGAGLVYGLRAHGPWAPRDGHRFNPAKLLLDPWAREIVGEFRWDDRQRGHDAADPSRADPRDNGDIACKARVVGDDGYDWQADAPPAVPWSRTVLYELHVRGFTKRHPGVAEAQRGTFAGLASDAAIAHFRRLGVTSLSLLPVHQHLDEERLVRLGLTNYWGYNTQGFFCPHPRYGSRGTGRALRDEFRDMVRRLHAAGLEVVLDVVYNHTAETDETGPTLSWRGLDNSSWYRLDGTDRARYENPTGTGNALDLRQPRVLQLVTDSLRWWVEQMHVDGFRFDLAPVLGRGDHGFDRRAAFFAAVAQDPVLQRVKLIAEPWDIGRGGYQLGAFPTGWAEWNDRFRDTVRAFWLGQASDRGEFARRLCASSDLFEQRQRAPWASVNFVTAHDGFTLRDLVSHDRRHNAANGEGNRDGHAHNLSWNCGVEGPTDDPAVRDRRARLQRALLAVLLLAQGTPMLAAGAELGHTQRGNNNPYCQDNDLTWLDWSAADEALIDWAATLISARTRWQPFDGRWTTGQPGPDGRIDLDWRRPDGRPLDAADWHDAGARVLGALSGDPADGGPPWLLLVNATAADVDFRLPDGRWCLMLCSLPGARPSAAPLEHQAPLPAHALRLLRRADR
jgi:glycogen operon protein